MPGPAEGTFCIVDARMIVNFALRISVKRRTWA